MRSASYVSARLAPCTLRSFDRGLAPASLTLNASMLAVAVVAAGFLRVVMFEAATVDAFAISASLFLIVTSSVVLGTVKQLAPRAPAPSTQRPDRPQKRPSLSISTRPSQALPLALNKARIDAAHASTSIQVIMDVLGVLITCTVAPLVFENAERIFA